MHHKVEEESIQIEHYNHKNDPNLHIVLQGNYPSMIKSRTNKPQATRSAMEIALIRRG